MANVLPNLGQTVDLDLNKDATVESVEVTRERPKRVHGSIRNKTDRVVSVELTLKFTDSNVSNVGSDTFEIRKIPANGKLDFSFPLAIENAVYALVDRIIVVE